MELSEKAREALLSAASAQDVAATLAAEGIDADDEMARRIWREACARRGEDELSVSLAGPVSRLTAKERETLMTAQSQKEIFDLFDQAGFFRLAANK